MASASIGDLLSLNLFAYTRNNPVDFVDPSGLETYNCTVTKYRYGFSQTEEGAQYWYSWQCELEQSKGSGGGSGKGSSGRGGDKPKPVTPPCDAENSGDPDKFLLAQFIYGESDHGNSEELGAIGRVFLNRLLLNSTEFGCSLKEVLIRGSGANNAVDKFENVGTVPFRQARNKESIAKLNPQACLNYRKAYAAASQTIDRINYLSPLKSPWKKGTVGDNIFRGLDRSYGMYWFLGGKTVSEPTMTIGDTRFFDYFPGRRKKDGSRQTAQDSFQGRGSCGKKK